MLIRTPNTPKRPWLRLHGTRPTWYWCEIGTDKPCVYTRPGKSALDQFSYQVPNGVTSESDSVWNCPVRVWYCTRLSPTQHMRTSVRVDPIQTPLISCKCSQYVVKKIQCNKLLHLKPMAITNLTEISSISCKRELTFNDNNFQYHWLINVAGINIKEKHNSCLWSSIILLKPLRENFL